MLVDQQPIWRAYKSEPRYRRSAFPFPAKRMALVDKLHSDFIALISVIGIIYWIVVFVRLFLGW